MKNCMYIKNSKNFLWKEFFKICLNINNFILKILHCTLIFLKEQSLCLTDYKSLENKQICQGKLKEGADNSKTTSATLGQIKLKKKNKLSSPVLVQF